MKRKFKEQIDRLIAAAQIYMLRCNYDAAQQKLDEARALNDFESLTLENTIDVVENSLNEQKKTCQCAR